MTKLMKRESTDLEQLPSWVTESTVTGFESIRPEDCKLPRLAICQSMSPQRQKGNELFIQGLEEGQIFNPVTKEVYEQPLRITPVLKQDARIKWPENGQQLGAPRECTGWADRKVPGGIACELNNGGPCKYPTIGEKDSCTRYYHFPVILHSAPEDPLVLTFKSTGIAVAQNWISQMMMFRIGGVRVPMFAQQFDLTTVQKRNSKGTFYNFSLTRIPGLAPENVGQHGAKLCEELTDKTIVTDLETAPEPTREPGDEDM